MNSYTVFIVEDDTIIAATIAKSIQNWGCNAVVADDFSDIMTQFVQAQPHLVLMDITLPFFNGYYWCAKIRESSKVPIIFISSASDNMNIIMAMNMGADDFIAKPFELSVLTAKLQAMLRRTYDFSSTSATLIEHNGAILNLSDASLYVGEQRVELTKNEFRILQVLLENRGSIVSRDTLMQRLWETDSFVDENTLTVNVTRLRKKLDGAGLCEYITTKKGIGYVIL